MHHLFEFCDLQPLTVISQLELNFVVIPSSCLTNYLSVYVWHSENIINAPELKKKQQIAK